PKIYDNTWSEIWDRDDDPVAQLTGTDYADFNAGEYADYLDTGITCSKTNATAICFVNTTDNIVWMKIPHFSGVGTSLQGTTPTTTTDSDSSSGTTDSDRITKTWGTLSSGATQTMNIYKKSIGIRKIQLKVKTDIQNAKLVITNFGTTKPTETSEPSGDIYKYIKIVHTNINDSDIEEAFIEFEITKSWLEDNSIDKNDIRLLRYTDKWEVLDTEITEELTDYIRYKAPTPGFSYFAIGTVAAEEATTTTVTTTTTLPGETTTTTGGIIPTGINKKYVYIGILTAVIIIFLVLIFSRREVNKP
ncbi:MAG: PGF-pre-PGF domain-containing protein, partial [Candidatus Heimdallarchaeaceae archaeon]